MAEDTGAHTDVVEVVLNIAVWISDVTLTECVTFLFVELNHEGDVNDHPKLEPFMPIRAAGYQLFHRSPHSSICWIGISEVFSQMSLCFRLNSQQTPVSLMWIVVQLMRSQALGFGSHSGSGILT